MSIGCCNDCQYLDKSRRKFDDTGYCFIYGCNYRKNGLIVGWIIANENETTELKNMGCSGFEEKKKNEQMSLF